MAEPPRGVGGWLLFLCLTLTVLMPLATLVANFSGWPEPALLELFPRLAYALWAAICGEVLVNLYAIGTGIALWRVSPGALPRARRFLLALLGWRLASPFLMAGLAGLPEDGTRAMLLEGLKDTARTAAFVLAWWLYLKRSRRVAATYGA
ncbi:DUF2569 domain-containing protein [Siccirubricoccus sp. KC 17139]|uniref:DUF2569 domain-containing protein n=1 Tax=Siccirubricoccus soli TaxID=2899147 RepID=A0ABT1D536_9PROT|nr:DUF2569 family protein [Siccirubricoccus soli]MCO6416732.1 DUF2569 domain-containing protein [Siccirubricoccus soli]MCP2682867.1 DUF2569 domain-containing protein [Siccirubricoccus soli]